MPQLYESRDAKIQLERREHAALCYHVLAHLELGSDAATLFDPRLPPRPWRDALTDAYARARGRLRLQFLGIETTSFDELRARLSGDRRDPALEDADGRALAAAFARALELERPRHAARWRAQGSLRDHATRLDSVIETLSRLRAVLWEASGGPPPPLTIVDCPALGWCGRASHRARPGGGRHRVIGVSFARPDEHVVCQVFHEETHRVTDPVVLGGRSGQRDTRVGQPGHELHEALELAAVEAGQAIIDVRAPALRDAYRRWRERFGMTL